MTKIVKSMAVVDNRATPPPVMPQEIPRVHGVIKRQALGGQTARAAAVPLPVKDAYLDELNRLRVEIKQAKEELRDLGRLSEEARRVDRQESAHREESAMDAEDAQGRAREILAEAQRQAQEILAEAQAEGIRLAEEAKNNGYLEGFAKGYEESGQEFHSEYDPKMVQIAELLDRLSDLEEKTLREQEKDLITLAVTIASKVIGRALEADPTAVTGMLRAVVEENGRAEYVKITLSPDMMPVEAKASAQVRQMLTDMGVNVSVVADSSLPPGSATVETPKGVVDVSIATQLNNLKSAILDD